MNLGNPSTLNPLAPEYFSSEARIVEDVNHSRAARHAAVDYFEDPVEASQRTMDGEEEDVAEEEREPNGPAPTGAGQTGGIFGPHPDLTTVRITSRLNKWPPTTSGMRLMRFYTNPTH